MVLNMTLISPDFNIFFSSWNCGMRSIVGTYHCETSCARRAKHFQKIHDLGIEDEITSSRYLYFLWSCAVVLRSYILFSEGKKIAKVLSFGRTSLALLRSAFSSRSRRRRTASTRIVYESSRWGPPAWSSRRSASSSSRGGGSRRGRGGETVEYHEGGTRLLVFARLPNDGQRSP